ncbi:hypothetical protein NP493_108g02002 [Ridgeia piscesae]|uniref:Hepatocellular carcinoma-associated antigen 59 n=1 Tax=Ridgeia piscesae TaxID=27915 RepID=A0AAD9P782_RIDPI|nr:hypothetical protein NP493_108g02002 [Ridgeia piscesae]
MMSKIKKIKRIGNLRKRRHSSDSSDESDGDNVGCVVTDVREIQELRRRQYGVSAESLASGKPLTIEEKGPKDVFKLSTGGYVDMKTLKKEITAEDMEELKQIGTSFAAETNQRDEDAEMVKYVEEALAKRKGIEKQASIEEKVKNPEDALYELPENIKNITSSIKRSEDMLSNQMLSGIPELDLGIEVKIRNIEATEEAKQKLLRESQSKKDSGIVDFVPTNMAVNFMQHNRFNIESTKTAPKREVAAPKVAPARVGDAERLVTNRPISPPDHLPKGRGKGRKNVNNEKATDDFHFEKFKKQMRRY